jgi:hypothetical protein
MIKSRSMRWAGLVTRMWEINPYKISVGKPEYTWETWKGKWTGYNYLRIEISGGLL